MTTTNNTKAIETAVTTAGFATAAEIMRITGLDYATICDEIEDCAVRGVFRGNAWGYVAR